MNTLIKVALSRPITILDDKIIYKKQEIPFSSIKTVGITPKAKTHSIRTLCITFTDETCIIPSFDQEISEHNEAILYFLSCIDKNVEEEFRKDIATKIGTEPKEFKKRCKVCGKIICYNLEDIKENKRHEKNATWASLTTLAGALSGNYAAGATSGQTAEDERSRIIDYTKCPSCGSRDLVDITDEDIAKANAQSTVSNVDELKTFKELLDSGIITQEEFDQKKKQLLGL